MNADRRDADAPVGGRACRNCGEPIALAFCGRCGQKDLPRRMTFREAAGEMVSSVLSFDSKIARTLPRFLFRTGALTRDYLDGRRARYTSPLRLFLLASLVLGLSLSLEGVLRPDRDTLVRFDPGSSSGAEHPGADRGGDADDRASPDASLTATTAPSSEGSPAAPTARDARRTEAVVTAPPMGVVDRFLAWKEDRLRGMDDDERTAAFTGSFKRVIPTAAFFLLPVFAFVLRLAMLGTGRTYPEMLVFLAHVQAWAFLAFAIALWFGRELASVSVLASVGVFFWSLKVAFGLRAGATARRGALAAVLFVPTFAAGIVGMLAAAFALA